LICFYDAQVERAMHARYAEIDNLASNLKGPLYSEKGGRKCMSAQKADTTVIQKILHLPDYRFAAWCLRRYGVNRGIYNTIDERLFQFGIKDIVTRRMTILSFLNQVQQSQLHQGNGKKIKFGKGLLISTLTQFLNQEVVFTSVRSAADDSISEVNDPWH